MYLPQPIASSLRSPPEDTKLPTLSSAAFPAPYIHARWKFECPLTLSSSFVEWYMLGSALDRALWLSVPT